MICHSERSEESHRFFAPLRMTSPTSDFGLRTSDFGLRTSDFGLKNNEKILHHIYTVAGH